jgi:hypothetical protein
MRPNLVPVEFVLGPNWVVTAHREEVPVLEEFLERAEGGGQVGGLDAPSFVAAICEWVIASYLRAFEAVEAELEELDAKVRYVCAGLAVLGGRWDDAWHRRDRASSRTRPPLDLISGSPAGVERRAVSSRGQPPATSTSATRRPGGGSPSRKASAGPVPSAPPSPRTN